ANATILSPEAFEEIRNSREKVKNAVMVMAKKYHISTKRIYEIWHKHALGQPDHAQQDIISSDPLLHLREVPSDQNSDNNEKSSHDDTSSSGSSIQTQTDKKKSKSVRISDNKDLSKKVGRILETKKEQVSKIPLSSSLSSVILQDSEDTLEVFKKSQSGMEKAVAKGHALEQELKT
ncbi:7191_t:CDS:1, partial [Funneliformis geosporum]